MDQESCHHCIHMITLLNQEFDKLQTQYKELEDKYKDLKKKLDTNDKIHNEEINYVGDDGKI